MTSATSCPPPDPSLPDTQPVWIVDTFCGRGFLGNPAAVVEFDDGFPETPVMQSAAAALALPTTAFIVATGSQLYNIRWFTPEQELQLCGHASVAAASMLSERTGLVPGQALHFATRFGSLHAETLGGSGIAIDLPTLAMNPGTPPPGLQAALGAVIVACAYSIDDLVVELASEEAVATLAPDFSALKTIDCRGHVVTAAASADSVDFVSRSFFPALGVNEDQVCISAHCKLAPYWSERLGKRVMTAIQLSERGGALELRLSQDRVQVAGDALLRRETTFGAEKRLAPGGLYRS